MVIAVLAVAIIAAVVLSILITPVLRARPPLPPVAGSPELGELQRTWLGGLVWPGGMRGVSAPYARLDLYERGLRAHGAVRRLLWVRLPDWDYLYTDVQLAELLVTRWNGRGGPRTGVGMTSTAGAWVVFWSSDASTILAELAGRGVRTSSTARRVGIVWG